MKQIILPVTVHLNIRLPLALLQPEPADAPTGPEPELSLIHILLDETKLNKFLDNLNRISRMIMLESE